MGFTVSDTPDSSATEPSVSVASWVAEPLRD